MTDATPTTGTALAPDPERRAGSGPSPFELNIAEQPDALRRLAGATLPSLGLLTHRTWDRVVLTGMGSSYFAGLTSWRRLVALGLNAWAVDTGQLLDNDALLSEETLLIVTSQSGASGEVAELLERHATARSRGVTVVGVTNDETSLLARTADLFLPLHSGAEATVSTKSYLNSVAAHQTICAAITGGSDEERRQLELNDAADATQAVIDGVDLSASAVATAEHPARRLAFIGAGDSTGTALFAALITKEAAKIASEGYIGGQFRHGPFELAGDGLSAVIFAPERHTPDASLRRLAADLVDTGSHVIVVGDPGSDATVHVPVGGTTELAFTAASAVVAELFAVDLAHANHVTPGAFIHGSKITTTI